MRYFIAHLVQGETKRYRDRITRELTHRYQQKAPKSPAHITIKPPFECGLMGIVAVEKELRAYARLQTAAEYRIRGFGRFGFKTIYLNVVGSPDLVRLVRGCVAHLNKTVPWLPRAAMEGNKPHISVARHLDRKMSARIWRELRGYSPEAKGRFDTLTVLKFQNRKWVVRSTIRIPRTARLPLWDT